MSKQFLGELKWVAPGESGQQRLEDFLGASYRGQQPGLPNVVPGYELTPPNFSTQLPHGGRTAPTPGPQGVYSYGIFKCSQLVKKTTSEPGQWTNIPTYLSQPQCVLQGSVFTAIPAQATEKFKSFFKSKVQTPNDVGLFPDRSWVIWYELRRFDGKNWIMVAKLAEGYATVPGLQGLGASYRGQQPGATPWTSASFPTQHGGKTSPTTPGPQGKYSYGIFKCSQFVANPNSPNKSPNAWGSPSLSTCQLQEQFVSTPAEATAKFKKVAQTIPSAIAASASGQWYVWGQLSRFDGKNWIVVLSTLKGYEITPEGQVNGVGEPVGVGGFADIYTSAKFMFVAYKGKSILKQWGVEHSTKDNFPWGSGEGGAASWYPPTTTMLLKEWSSRPAGTDRLCCALVGTNSGPVSGPLICYDGKTFTQGVHIENKPTITCGPGQVAYQHPDGSWGCQKWGFAPEGQSFSLCPSGQHWSAPLKRCVPTKQQPYKGPVPVCPAGTSFDSKSGKCVAPPPPQHPVAPYFRGGMTQGLGGAQQKTPQQRLVDFIEGEAKLSQSRFLGEVQWLGAIPSLIKKWFPERTDAEWNGLSQADQFTFSQQASAVEATWNAKINEMRANGACDATKPGLLAGAMREYLIKSGGLLANMDDLGAKAFGPKDCLEWVRVFGKAPDQETVAKGIGLATGGATPWVKNSANGYSLQVTLQSVCPNGFKLPSCAVSPPPPPTACDNSKCPPGTECCQENWTEGDLANCAPGTCVNKCPNGYTRAPTGVCKPTAVASTGTSSSGLGLLVLGSAALGLAFFASKSELAAIPKHPSQKLQANKSRRRRRR